MLGQISLLALPFIPFIHLIVPIERFKLEDSPPSAVSLGVPMHMAPPCFGYFPGVLNLLLAKFEGSLPIVSSCRFPRVIASSNEGKLSRPPPLKGLKGFVDIVDVYEPGGFDFLLFCEVCF